MIQRRKGGYRAVCHPCHYTGKWKQKRREAEVAMAQHECSGKHRRYLRQQSVRPSA